MGQHKSTIYSLHLVKFRRHLLQPSQSMLAQRGWDQSPGTRAEKDHLSKASRKKVGFSPFCFGGGEGIILSRPVFLLFLFFFGGVHHKQGTHGYTWYIPSKLDDQDSDFAFTQFLMPESNLHLYCSLPLDVTKHMKFFLSECITGASKEHKRIGNSKASKDFQMALSKSSFRQRTS